MICDYTEQVDIRKLVKQGLSASWIYNPVTQYYESLQITQTPCNFGGVRQWFSCPECDKRCPYFMLLPISLAASVIRADIA